MSGPVPADARVAATKELRRIRRRRLILRFGLGVVLPTLLAATYYGAIVTPRYESVASFTIQAAEGQAPTSALQMLVTDTAGGAVRDGMLVFAYIQSQDMLRHLEEEHGFREHYQAESVDWLSRVPADASFEDRHEHYLKQVEVEQDTQSGVLTLRVRAYDREHAEAFGRAILEASERMVNRMSETAREDRIRLGREELERAEARLGTARQALVELQAEGGELNPMLSAGALLDVRSRIEGELAIARAELSTLGATLPAGAAPLQEQRRRVAALQRQIDEQTRRMASGDANGLHASIARFEPIVVEKEFAQRAYESALASMELARVDASRQHRYLVRIAGPSTPDSPAHPRFWWSLLKILVLCIALLGIGTLLVASVREHANV